MSTNELEMFIATWNREADSTMKLLRALPATQYDFRPDAGGRSLGELAWHLAEGDAYMSYGIDTGGFAMETKPPHIERPRTVDAIGAGLRSRPPGRRRAHPQAQAGRSRPHPELFWKPDADSRDSLGNDPPARRAPPGPALVDVPTGGRTGARPLRAEPRRDGSFTGQAMRRGRLRHAR